MSQANANAIPSVPVAAQPHTQPPPVPTKPWYASAGVWGALVTLAGSVLTLLKVQLDPRLLDDVRDWLLSLATLVGGAVALWGRIRATARIVTTSVGAAAPRHPSTLPPPTDGFRALMFGALVAASLAAGGAAGGGCAALSGPAGPYVAADRATYDAVAPEYRAYVSANVNLTGEERSRRARTLETWRLRLEDEERRAAGVVEP